MKCPHCLTEFHDEPTETILMREKLQLSERDGTSWKANSRVCPACGRATIVLISTRWVSGGSVTSSVAHTHEYQVWPKGIARAPLPKEVTEQFASDYREACLVLADSPKASAALSRRCLQNLLIEKAGVQSKDLFDQIQEVLDSKALPNHLADDLDAVRVIGNFGAHPIKSKTTGQVTDVEPGEAEWNLDVLEGLFDFYFIGPEKQKRRRDTLNAKLKDAGKPPLR